MVGDEIAEDGIKFLLGINGGKFVSPNATVAAE